VPKSDTGLLQLECATKYPPSRYNAHRMCRYGEMIYNRHDAYVGRSLELYGEFSEGEVELFRAVLGEGDVALDIGANIGCHTVALSRIVGPTGQVYAFEPQLQMYMLLCGNVALNCHNLVIPVSAALGATTGQTSVPPIDYGQPGNFGGLELGSHPHGDLVPVASLDTFGFERVALAKIDVEGWERDVLVGGNETIRKTSPILYVENDRKEKSTALVSYLTRELGYGPIFWHTPPLYNPENYDGNKTNVFGRVVSINLLCAPPRLTPRREAVLAYAVRAGLIRVA